MQNAHSAILLTFIMLPFVINMFVLSIFEWPFYTGSTVYEKYRCLNCPFYAAGFSIWFERTQWNFDALEGGRGGGPSNQYPFNYFEKNIPYP